MNRVFRNELIFKRMPTMEMRRTVLDDQSTARIPSGYRRLHSIPEFYPQQQQIQKMFNDYYNVPSLGNPAYRRNTQDNEDDWNRLQQMKMRAENEAKGAVQYMNTKRRDGDFTSEDVQRRLQEMPNNEEIARAIQVFENKLSLLNLSNERKKQVRDEFYNNIFQADKEIIFNIAKDETGKDIKEILKLVRQANIGGDNAELGVQTEPVEGADVGMQTGEEMDEFDEKVPEEEAPVQLYGRSRFFEGNLRFNMDIQSQEELDKHEMQLIKNTVENKHKANSRPLTMDELRDVIELAISGKKLKGKNDEISKRARALVDTNDKKKYLRFIKYNS